ncbi:hypothetical protein DU701_17265 [Salmonella enterica]|nr:hypothetical protein [Salmonella enterica]EBJ4571013.1 hypothetical protein [Salmonella enterica]EBK5977542.1 hypothetical protein [Salmonella enterica]EBM0235608.1 hypothetical protein [Salmonella enterica]EBO5255383.1 hypothetical protein [Salmonella enterica]
MFEFILLVLLTISNVATYILVMILFIFAFLFFTVEGWMILLCIFILSSIFGKDDEKKCNK